MIPVVSCCAQTPGRYPPFQLRFYILNESAGIQRNVGYLGEMARRRKRNAYQDAPRDCAIKPGCPLFLDGERVNVSKKAEISFVSDAVNLIVPKPNQGISLFADFKCNLLQRGVRIY
jgi:hypothetical protein